MKLLRFLLIVDFGPPGVFNFFGTTNIWEASPFRHLGMLLIGIYQTPHGQYYWLQFVDKLWFVNNNNFFFEICNIINYILLFKFGEIVDNFI